MEDLLAYSRLIAAVVTALSFIFGAYVYFSNSRKERIRCTLSYWENFYTDVKKRILDFNADYSDFNEAIYEKIASHNTDKNKLHDILNSFEKLALGVNLGAYDLVALNRAAGKTITTIYSKYEPYIVQRRDSTNNPNSWSEFELLNDQLCKLRRKS